MEPYLSEYAQAGTFKLTDYHNGVNISYILTLIALYVGQAIANGKLDIVNHFDGLF